MSNLAVRDDLFGFVRAFLTPRQGVDDNTNPKPEQGGEATNAPPESPADVPAPGATPTSGMPQPTGTRALPEAGYGGAPVYVPPGLSKEDEQLLAQSQSYRILQAQQAEAQRQALEQYRWSQLVGGVSGIAGGLTGGSFAGTPAAAPPGSDFASGSPMLTLDAIKGFESDALKAKQAAEAKASAIAFAKEHGVSDADINAAIAGGDYSKLRELAGKRIDPKESAEGQQAQLAAKKAQEFDQVMRDPDLVGRLMAATGTNDPAILRSLYLTGKLDTVLEKAAQGGPDYAEYIKAYPGGVDAKTGRPFSYADYLAAKQANASPTGGQRKTLLENIAKQHDKAWEAGDQARLSLGNVAQRYQLLREGKIMTGAIFGTEGARTVAGYLNALGFKTEGLSNAQEMISRTATDVMSAAKTLGANPTDTDRMYIEKAKGGDLSFTQKALEAITRLQMQNNILQQIRANESVDKLLATVQDPETRAQLAQQRINIADYTDAIFQKGHIDIMNRAIADPDPANRQRAMENFDRFYGPGMAQYYFEKRGGAGGQ